jgi:hypothetical protein
MTEIAIFAVEHKERHENVATVDRCFDFGFGRDRYSKTDGVSIETDSTSVSLTLWLVVIVYKTGGVVQRMPSAVDNLILLW